MNILRSVLKLLRNRKQASAPSLLAYSIAATTGSRVYTKESE